MSDERYDVYVTAHQTISGPEINGVYGDKVEAVEHANLAGYGEWFVLRVDADFAQRIHEMSTGVTT
jgi:hypothetical protein